jgi:hypothetical protein
MSFAPDRIKVREGEQIKFALKNASTEDQEFMPNSLSGFIQHQPPLAYQARQASLQRFPLHDLIRWLQLEIVWIIRRPVRDPPKRSAAGPHQNEDGRI